MSAPKPAISQESGSSSMVELSKTLGGVSHGPLSASGKSSSQTPSLREPAGVGGGGGGVDRE